MSINLLSLTKCLRTSSRFFSKLAFEGSKKTETSTGINMELYYQEVSPPARAVYATIKHLGLPVNLKAIDLLGYETRTEKFLKINPVHQVPILIDNGQVMGESRAIMSYLVNQYSPNHSIYPADPKVRVNIDRILQFEGINFFPAVRQILRRRVRQNVEPTEEEIENVRVVVGELIALKASNRFMAGDQVSLADISIAMTYTLLKFFMPEEAARLSVWYRDIEVAVPVVKEINDSIDFTRVIEMMKK